MVDSNPYSRLMALQRMGIVKDYERIREKTVVVVGVGGTNFYFLRRSSNLNFQESEAS